MSLSMKIINKKVLISKSNFYKPFLLFILFIISIFIILLSNLSEIRKYALYKGFRFDTSTSILNEIKFLPKNFFFNITSSSISLPALYIDVPFKNYSELSTKVQNSILAGKIVQDENDYVKAKIRSNDVSLKSRIRIKGDQVDHVSTDKWSLRVKIVDKGSFFGLKKFSLHHPYVRGFYGQKLLELSRNFFGLYIPRRFLVNVIINGDNIGIMEVEEHFSKEMLEYNKLKESVILKLDEDNYWNYGNTFNMYNSKIETFGSNNKIKLKDHPLYKSNNHAIGLLRGLLTKKLKPSEVFNVDQVSLFLAVNRLWGSNHGVRWGNIRFYYNPYLGSIELISFEDNFHERLFYNLDIREEFVDLLLSDDLIYKSYDKHLKKISSDDVFKSLLLHLKNGIEEYKKSMSSEYFFLPNYSFDDLIMRKNYVLKTFNAKSSINSSTEANKLLVNLYTNLLPGSINLAIENNSSFDINNMSLSSTNTLINNFLIDKFENKNSINLNKNDSLLINIPFEIESISDNLFSADYSFDDGSHEVNRVSSIMYPNTLSRPIFEESNTLNELINSNKISINSDKSISIINTNLDELKSLYIPNYYNKLYIVNSNLRFQSGMGIISNVPVEIIDTTIKNGFLYVYNAKNSSSISTTSFINPSSIQYNKFSLESIITFYRSDVEVKSLTMDKIKTEDALNIVHSKFVIESSLFSNTLSDAIDLDFSTGVISSTSFEKIGLAGGGDGLDLSGSDVRVFDCNFKNVNDKAISVGERSKAVIKNVIIDRSSVGIASKDGSKVFIEDSKIYNSSFANLMAYVKKPEYSGGQISAKNLDLNKKNMLIRDELSLINIDDNYIPPKIFDTKKLYKTIMKPGVKK